MADTSFLSNNRFLFFFSRALILLGMVLFFLSVFSFGGVFLVKSITGYDLMNLQDVIFKSRTDQAARNAVLLFQALAGSIGTFLIPSLLFPGAIQRSVHGFIRTYYPFRLYFLLLAPAFILISMPFIGFLQELNQGIKLPSILADYEQMFQQMEQQAKELTEIMVIAPNAKAFFVSLLVMALLPAIAEEFFFRGILQNFTRSVFYNPHLAIWFAAFVFSAIHGQFYGFIPRLVLGAVLGYLYHFSGNIWVPVLAHFVNNGLALTGFVLLEKYPNVAIFKEDYHFPIWVSLLSAILSVGIMVWLHKQQFRKFSDHE